MSELFTVAERSACLSQCRTYRYSLWRRWGPATPYCMFVGLNPSTADESNDDPTIRRCIAFARSWGYDALCMANLFAFRATQPADMMKAADPVGPRNDDLLVELADGADVIVAAWGAHGAYLNRAENVRVMLLPLRPKVLRLTKDGHPGHPLYLPGNLKPQLWG